jgi:hypothetical protein
MRSSIRWHKFLISSAKAVGGEIVASTLFDSGMIPDGTFGVTSNKTLLVSGDSLKNVRKM